MPFVIASPFPVLGLQIVIPVVTHCSGLVAYRDTYAAGRNFLRDRVVDKLAPGLGPLAGWAKDNLPSYLVDNYYDDMWLRDPQLLARSLHENTQRYDFPALYQFLTKSKGLLGHIRVAYAVRGLLHTAVHGVVGFTSSFLSFITNVSAVSWVRKSIHDDRCLV
jgi:hypothetical protein